jgi:hypothetical protein
MFLVESKEKMQVWPSSLNLDFVFCGQRESWMTHDSTSRLEDLERSQKDIGVMRVVEPRGYRPHDNDRKDN